MIIVAQVMSPREESRLGRLTPDASCSDTVRQRLFAGRMRRVALNDAAPCQSLLQEAQSLKLCCSTKKQGRSIRESIWCASPSDHVYCMSFPLHRSRVIILLFYFFTGTLLNTRIHSIPLHLFFFPTPLKTCFVQLGAHSGGRK